MDTRRFQRGELPMGCILAVILLAVVGLIAIKATPVMLAMGDLEREVRILADRGNRIEYNDKRIVKEIVETARGLQLPVVEENVTVQRGESRIVIEVRYEKAIEFPGYTYIWKKRLHEDRPLF